MLYLLLYLIVGIAVTSLMNHNYKKKIGHPVRPVVFMVSTLGWPYFIWYWVIPKKD